VQRSDRCGGTTWHHRKLRATIDDMPATASVSQHWEAARFSRHLALIADLTFTVLPDTGAGFDSLSSRDNTRFGEQLAQAGQRTIRQARTSRGRWHRLTSTSGRLSVHFERRRAVKMRDPRQSHLPPRASRFGRARRA
jgi:hypothetical protein